MTEVELYYYAVIPEAVPGETTPVIAPDHSKLGIALVTEYLQKVQQTNSLV